MKRYVIATSALLALASCTDGIVDPVQQQDLSPPAANGVASFRVQTPGTSGRLADGTVTGSTVIDFESLVGGGVTMAWVASYSEDGFTLMNPDYSGHDAFGAPLPGHPYYQGSIALMSAWPDAVTVLTKDDGGEFTAISIDIAEFNPNHASPLEVPFTGTRADGSTVTATFTTDGVAGFETFTFEGFTNLVSLSWVQVGMDLYQVDNIVLGDPVVLGPLAPETKDDCMDDGWDSMGFKNQGQCIRMVETGQDSR